MLRELHIIAGRHGPEIPLPAASPDWDRPVTLLIHGYNVDPPAAFASYSGLLKLMERKGVLPPLIRSGGWLVYWPGYASGGLAHGKMLLSPLTYANQIPSACQAAKALRRYIDEHSGGRAHLNIIAHSLGCRLALELLDSYAKPSLAPRPTFSTVVLMAAAVPAFFLRDLVRLWRAPGLAEQVVVLFSRKDAVLHRCFPAGQTMAGEGILPEAVGRRGRPTYIWTRCQRTRNGHSGYFGDPATADAIARAFGRAGQSRLPEAEIEQTNARTGGRRLPESTLSSRRPPRLHPGR